MPGHGDSAYSSTRNGKLEGVSGHSISMEMESEKVGRKRLERETLLTGQYQGTGAEER